MRVVDGTGFQAEFNESPTLATYAHERISQICGHVERLALEDGDELTVFDFGTIVVRGGTLRAFGDGTVYAFGGVVYAHDEVRVLAFGQATVVAAGHTQTVAHDKVTFLGYERSRVTLRSFSSGELHDFAIGSFYNFTRGELHDNASGYSYDMTEIEVHGDHTALRGRGNTRVQINGTPAVRLAGNAVGHTAAGTRTQFIDTTDKARIESEPIVRAADVPLTPSGTPTAGYQTGGSPQADRATAAAGPQIERTLTPAAVPAPAASAAAPQRDTAIPAQGAAASDTGGHDMPTPTGAAVPLPDFGPEWRPLRAAKSR